MPEEAPFQGVSDFFSELNRMRELGRQGHQEPERARTYGNAWVPTTDIFSRDGDLVMRIELAGMDPDDVTITFSQGVLTISGERGTAIDTGGEESFYVRERPYGAFRRPITLPEGTTDDAISAEFENGLVEITIRGGNRAADPRRIRLTRASR